MKCTQCPRRCNIDRPDSLSGTGAFGRCKAPLAPVVARAALHFGEEPCISGTRGSGAVFFCGCPLQCVFCQNRDISRSLSGAEITCERLAEIFRDLEDQGAHNINLVTASHYTDALLNAFSVYKPSVPVVYNCSGYELPETIRRLEGYISVYIPDMKYSSSAAAAKYSCAPDYPERAKEAIHEMYRQRGPCIFDDNGLLLSGVLIRHLILPGNLKNTFGVIDFVAESFPKGSVLFSLMSQFTPMESSGFKELERRLSRREYEAAERYLFASGIEDGFCQELSSARKSFIPDFDLTGVIKKD
ncbi:MAG: radical SAM protein [Oscillospiraceae bacterium]|nr:radical SAM protein [Oscillospiraceae bacterium]